jgi:hypothetical protein
MSEAFWTGFLGAFTLLPMSQFPLRRESESIQSRMASNFNRAGQHLKAAYESMPNQEGIADGREGPAKP